MKKFSSLLIFVFMMVNVPLGVASDHIDGPVTSKNAVTDLTDLYAFPSPDKPGYLSLVVNSYPFVRTTGHFSEKVNYVFDLRKAAFSEDRRKFETFDPIEIVCSFKTPNSQGTRSRVAHTESHTIHCRTSLGLSASTQFNEASPVGDLRVFGGMVSDPFFFNKDLALTSLNDGVLIDVSKSSSEPENAMAQLNVLSVVVQINVNKIFKDYQGEAIAVAVRSMTKGSKESIFGEGRQIDRIGRPEITNYTISPRGKDELRDKFNLEAPFTRPYKYEKEYFDRIKSNILSHYDVQDNVQNWEDTSADRLTNILLDDFLVVAPDKPCEGDRFFDIEMSLFYSTKINSCGGRKLTDDISDRLLSLYINSNLDEVDDGVDKPYRPISIDFPYLAKPEKSISAQLKSWVMDLFL